MNKKPKSLADLAYDQLRADIMSGRFKPGERLSMRALANPFGTSTTPMRDAALRLVREGAISQPNSRVFAIRKLKREEFEEIQEIRGNLEGLAAKHAAERISKGKLAKITKLHEAFLNGVIDNRAKANAMNTDFHLAIADASEKEHIKRIVESLWLSVGPLFLDLHRNMPIENFEPESHRHADILTALADGDGDRAQKAMRTDIDWGTKMVLDLDILNGAKES